MRQNNTTTCRESEKGIIFHQIQRKKINQKIFCKYYYMFLMDRRVEKCFKFFFFFGSHVFSFLQNVIFNQCLYYWPQLLHFLVSMLEKKSISFKKMFRSCYYQNGDLKQTVWYFSVVWLPVLLLAFLFILFFCIWP